MRSIDRALVAVLSLLTVSSAALGVASAAVAFAPEPPLVATPPATCGPGSRPETGMQGRVSPEDHASGRAAKGFTCNTELVGSLVEPNGQGTYGGYKVERYVDAAGHECAYYDTTLLFPTDLVDGKGGVDVVDMSDPTRPVVTDTLVTPAMLSPHESLVLSKARGILAAVLGNPLTNVGIIDVYDVSHDCRHPVLQSTSPAGLLGHESGMAPDGRTFYSASPGTGTIVAVDLDDPKLPVPIWFGQYPSHGLSVSDDGKRIYVASLEGLIILDTTEVQARAPNPEVTVVSRLNWDTMSIPQNAIPITIDDHPYLVEVDEFGAGSKVGAARIIDIADETAPEVISNLRLEVHQPESFAAIAGDNAATSPLQGYAGHYCNVPTRHDPAIVACSMILSGLRVFDIRDPYHPREIAYFNAPVQQRNVLDPSNYAMSSPSFVPERNEIWYSDGYSGFYNVHVTNDAWPKPGSTRPAPGPSQPSDQPSESPSDGPPDRAALPSTGGAGDVESGGAVLSSSGTLPTTGWRMPTLFAAATTVGALLLLMVLRRARDPKISAH